MRVCHPLVLRLGALACLPWLISGCSSGLGTSNLEPGSAAQAARMSLSGRVHGGQQAVSGAHVYLMAMGEAGLGSEATSLLQAGGAGVSVDSVGRGYVTSGADGTFSVTGDYVSCADPLDQVYVLALGGNPGLNVAGTNNAALTLAASVGACGSLTASGSVQINELSTVAFTSAFAAFATNAWQVGAPANLDGATADGALAASNLVGMTTGTANASLGSMAEPAAKVNTLGNALAVCVNSPSPDSAGCKALAQATGATDTLSAALAIAQSPATNVAALFAMGTPGSPFQPMLTEAPADWTLSAQMPAGLVTTPGVIELGDSITTLLPGNGATPVTSGYGALLASVLGSPFNNNVGPQTNIYSQGGDESIDSAYKAWIRGVPGATGNVPVTLMIGSNDGFLTDPAATNSSHEQVYRETLLAELSLWLTPPANKLFPWFNPACTNNGGWDFDGSFPGASNGLGVYTSTVGSLMTCSINSAGGAIYVWHLVDGAAGSASVTVDGAACGNFSSAYPGYDGSYNAQVNTVAALRCAVPAGKHQVTIMQTAGGHIGFEGLGTAPSGQLSLAAPPRMYTVGPLHQWSDQSATATMLYAKLMENVSAQLAADGYLVQYVNVRDHVTFNGTLDPGNTGVPGASCMANGLHPANCGHAQIAAVLSRAIAH